MSNWFHKGKDSEISCSYKCAGVGGGIIIPGSSNLCFWKRNNRKNSLQHSLRCHIVPPPLQPPNTTLAWETPCFQTYSSVLAPSTLQPATSLQIWLFNHIVEIRSHRIDGLVSLFPPKGSEQIFIGQLGARQRARARNSATNKMGQDTLLLDVANFQLCDLSKATFTQ